MTRFANKINCTVVGGFQKLLKYAWEYIQNNQYDGLLTYADLRFGEGKTYLKSNFELTGQTPIDYWYTDYNIRENRFKYRADKKNNLTEKQVAEQAGVKKIYGCGSNIYLKLINKNIK